MKLTLIELNQLTEEQLEEFYEKNQIIETTAVGDTVIVFEKLLNFAFRLAEMAIVVVVFFFAHNVHWLGAAGVWLLANGLITVAVMVSNNVLFNLPRATIKEGVSKTEIDIFKQTLKKKAEINEARAFYMKIYRAFYFSISFLSMLVGAYI